MLSIVKGLLTRLLFTVTNRRTQNDERESIPQKFFRVTATPPHGDGAVKIAGVYVIPPVLDVHVFQRIGD